MTTAPAVRSRSRSAATVVGRPKPRIGPPVPARSDVAGLRAVANEVGITLFPWQETAGRYLEALAPDGRHLYREVCLVVSRQNGKTENLIALIVKRLRAGRRIMHTAQNRDLPREVFSRVAEIMETDLTLFPTRNGRPTRPRFANGQEEIRLANGGRYKIVAPTRGGARGETNDDLIIDEVREMDSFDFIAAAKPTMTTSPDPQTIYLSNAGDEDSIVLNSIRDRATTDPRLAYLEWSAAPDRAASDQTGWMEANPSIGHIPTMLEYLTGEHETYRLSGAMSVFETEHLCRWVTTMREALVNAAAWNLCETDALARPARPYLAVSMAPEGTRASAALSWQQPDGTVALRLLFDVTGDPIDTHRLGTDLRLAADRYRVTRVGFDPMTDAELVKHFRKGTTVSINGMAFANASSQFANLVDAHRLRWTDSAAVSDDLTWTARKEHETSGVYSAVRASDDRPITASLAAVRAVWLSSGPRQSRPRVY